MTRAELAKARIAEIDSLQIEIAKALIALEDPCQFCGLVSSNHPRGQAAKPVGSDICNDCVETVDNKLLAAASQAPSGPKIKREN